MNIRGSAIIAFILLSAAAAHAQSGVMGVPDRGSLRDGENSPDVVVAPLDPGDATPGAPNANGALNPSGAATPQFRPAVPRGCPAASQSPGSASSNCN